MARSDPLDTTSDEIIPLESVVTDRDPREIKYEGQTSEEFSQRYDDFRYNFESKDASSEGIYESPFYHNILQNFDKLYHTQEEKEQVRAQLAKEDAESLKKHRAVLTKLRAWHDWDEARHLPLRKLFLSALGIPKRPFCPDEKELVELALYYFPPRAEIKVIICDYGNERTERFEHNLGSIEEVWDGKPEWVTLRWIHIPVGPGVLASSLEDIFLHNLPNFDRGFLGIDTYPSFKCEVLSLREREYLQDQTDVFNILRSFPSISEQLNHRNWQQNRNEGLRNDISWRSHRYETSLDFWDLVRSDLPLQLAEGIRSDTDGLSNSHKLEVPSLDDQALSRSPGYEKAILVRDLFQFFRGGDGFLLTMSALAGVSYIDKNLPRALALGPNARLHSPQYHLLECIRELLLDVSLADTETIPDWLLMKIILELQRTPNNFNAGRNKADVQNAYIPIIRDLKRRRGLRFKRHESVDLVREYVICMNEIMQIFEMSEQKIARLETLRDQWDQFTEKQTMKLETVLAESPTGAMTKSISTSIEMIRNDHKNLPRMLKDLEKSLDVLFQLRTIEQNELAIIAESNNKAILVFTVVTIVFLPLSFFTSYFGMNLQGIVNTDRTERYFWAVCGTVTVCIVSLTVLFGFKNRLHE